MFLKALEFSITRYWFLLFSIVFISTSTLCAQVSAQTQQLLVVIAKDWNAKSAELSYWQRQDAQSAWQRSRQDTVAVQLGRNGLAWGRGAFAIPPAAKLLKREKDGRSPAGLFAIGDCYGESPRVLAGSTLVYHQIGEWDVWVDDPQLAEYNQYIRYSATEHPPWFEQQRMKLGDPVYYWRLEIRHNRDPIVAGAGSAIFFHTRREPKRSTAGCTTMLRSELEFLLRWLNPQQHPHLVQLPKAEYQALQDEWQLPNVEAGQ